MIGNIINSICGEIKSFMSPESTGLRSTQFKPNEVQLYTMPLILIELENPDEMYQLIGGNTRADWIFTIHAYNYDYNQELSDDSGYNGLAYDYIEQITNYLGKGIWNTQAMRDIEINYNFRLTLNDGIKASNINIHDGGVIPGFGARYETVAMNNATRSITEITENSANIQGITAYKDKLNYLEKVKDKVTNSAYNNLTTASIGDRYWITDLRVIKKVLSIDIITHKPVTSQAITLSLNDALFCESKVGLINIWNGTNLIEVSDEVNDVIV